MFKINTPTNPITANKDEYIVLTLIACPTGKLKYSLNIQNPGSLTCEAKTLPDDVAKTINSGLTPDAATKGKTIPDAVVIATVAEPTAVLKSAAIIQASTIGEIFNLVLIH